VFDRAFTADINGAVISGHCAVLEKFLFAVGHLISYSTSHTAWRLLAGDDRSLISRCHMSLRSSFHNPTPHVTAPPY